MNEICGPIYYVFASQSDKKSQGNSLKLEVPLFECIILLYTEFAEADAFYCFSLIMIEIGDKFNKALDSSPTGYS